MRQTMARRAVAVAVIAVGVAAAGAALAGRTLSHHATASNVIQACVNKEGGLRIVDAGDACKKNESSLAWNKQGPQGAPGISVTTEQLPAGNGHCPTGGLQVTAATGVSFVCNGRDGKDGVSVTTTSLAVNDVNCPTGGVQVTSASGSTSVCNGAKGEAGAAGAAGPAGPQGPQGPQGPAGSSSAATLTSPNGVFRVQITDQGIYLRGPTKTLFVNRYDAGTGGPLAR